MKVYIVTHGIYGESDYYIDAVFLNREEAKKYIKLHDPYNIWTHYKIEEYETQEVGNPAGYVYSGYFDSENEFFVDDAYYIDFMNAKLGKLQIWLPEPNYEKAKKILVDRYFSYKSCGVKV